MTRCAPTSKKRNQGIISNNATKVIMIAKVTEKEAVESDTG